MASAKANFPDKLKPVEASCLSSMTGIRYGFFTRRGGVSDGIYASLNCGFGSDDDQTRVAENRSRVAAALGFAETAVSTPYQTHGAVALTISQPLDRENLPKADALVSSTPGVVIGVLTADCCPVLFADAEAGIVAAAHAGWRGAVGGILEATVDEMVRQGARKSAIRAAPGPCINQPSYEVGPDFRAAIIAADADSAAFLGQPEGADKELFDLPGYVGHRLSKLAVGGICSAAVCTYENESEFFSFRRTTHRQEPDYGRQISAIVVA